mmetsp:Transcript_23663/g.68109  ORF Transcript_23663/g.68109 Transcript_23663/m.68109 type:complete len:348 (+) Transcript_23663:226-1269(+)
MRYSCFCVVFPVALLCCLNEPAAFSSAAAKAATSEIPRARAPKPKRKLRILLTNDDGFATPLVQSLFRALTDAGHSVLLCAPLGNQSGTGMSIRAFQPLDVGETGLADGQWYVDSTPATALLYGLDVLAPLEWGSSANDDATAAAAFSPDLVISGPNEGNNLGYLTSISGTVGAALMALLRGIPSIAVSTNDGNADDEAKADTAAAIAVRLVHSLITGVALRIPGKTALNVNIPLITEMDPTAYHFVQTRVGMRGNFDLQAFSSLAASPVAQALGVGVDEPGLSVTVPYGTGGFPEDADPKSEGNVILGGGDDPLVVTVSPLEGTFDVPKKKRQRLDLVDLDLAGSV